MNAGGQGLGLLVAFLATPIVLREREPEDAALWLVFTGLFAILLAVEAAIARATVRRRVAGEAGSPTKLAIHLAAAIAASAGGVFAIALLFDLHDGPWRAGTAATVFATLAVAAPLMALTGVARGVREADLAFAQVQSVLAPATVLAFAWSAIAAMQGISLPLTAAAFLGVRAGLPPILLAGAFRGHGPTAPKGAVPETLWILAGSAAGLLLIAIERLALARYVSASQVAIYGAATDLVTGPQLLLAALVTAAFPAFVMGKHGLLRKAILIGFALMAGPALLFIVAPEVVCNLYLGDACTAEASSLVRVLGAGALFGVPAPFAAAWLVAKRRPEVMPKFYLWSLPFWVVLVFGIAMNFGVLGLAAMEVTRSLVDVGFTLAMARRTPRTTEGEL